MVVNKHRRNTKSVGLVIILKLNPVLLKKHGSYVCLLSPPVACNPLLDGSNRDVERRREPRLYQADVDKTV